MPLEFIGQKKEKQRLEMGFLKLDDGLVGTSKMKMKGRSSTQDHNKIKYVTNKAMMIMMHDAKNKMKHTLYSMQA